MTIQEQIKSDMDSVENTYLHIMLENLYQRSQGENMYGAWGLDEDVLDKNLYSWTGVSTNQEYDRDSDEHVFVDAMLRHKTCCAAFYLKKIAMKHDSKMRENMLHHIENIVTTACAKTHVNGQPKSFTVSHLQEVMDDLLPVLFNVRTDNCNFISLIADGPVDLAKSIKAGVNMQPAADWLLCNWLMRKAEANYPHIKMGINHGAITLPGRTVYHREPSAVERESRLTKIIHKGDTIHVSSALGRKDYQVTIQFEKGQTSFEFRNTDLIVGYYDALEGMTESELLDELMFIRRVGHTTNKLKIVAPEPAPSEAVTVVGCEPEPYYEGLKEQLHTIAELSTVTLGGHTGCRYNKKQWSDEFLRNVTALIGYDMTRNIHTDQVNTFDRLKDTIVERYDDSENDKIVLANIGSVLQICKMLACVRRDNVQDHPTERGYEYVIDYNKYWSMIKRLYGVDLSVLPKHVRDQRYHVMAALKGGSVGD